MTKSNPSPIRECRQCGHEFLGNNNRRYCSPECILKSQSTYKDPNRTKLFFMEHVARDKSIVRLRMEGVDARDIAERFGMSMTNVRTIIRKYYLTKPHG